MDSLAPTAASRSARRRSLSPRRALLGLASLAALVLVSLGSAASGADQNVVPTLGARLQGAAARVAQTLLPAEQHHGQEGVEAQVSALRPRTTRVTPLPMPSVPAPWLDLVLRNGKKISVQPFDEHGALQEAAFQRLAWAFAPDSGHQVDVDPQLVTTLVAMSQAFDGAAIRLVSGHRRPGSGTRKTSHHVSGRAADIAIAGVKPRVIRKAALKLGVPGVGLYPSFVHLDARRDRPYRWVGGRSWRRR